MKTLLAVATVVAGLSGGIAYAETSVGTCLAQYGSHVQHLDGVGDGCRALMFPASPSAPSGFYQVAGNQAREFALDCRAKYGATAYTIANVGGNCSSFYFPTGNGGRLAIQVPAAEAGGLY